MSDVEVHFGFTGTQRGLTPEQAVNLTRYMVEYREQFTDHRPLVLHHGDCVGADEEVHILSYEAGWEVELHPGTDAAGASPKRAFCENREMRHVRAIHEPCPYMERNMDIVLSGLILLAAPAGSEKTRSGTWSTVRAADRMGRMTIVFFPDGQMMMKNEDMEHGYE